MSNIVEVTKYIDGEHLVIIYKNFTKMDTEERIKIMENFATSEMSIVAGVEPEEPEIKITNFKEFVQITELPDNEKYKPAIKEYLQSSIQRIDVNSIQKWSKKQVSTFVKAYKPFLPKHAWELIKKIDKDGYEMARDLILILKEIV